MLKIFLRGMVFALVLAALWAWLASYIGVGMVFIVMVGFVIGGLGMRASFWVNE